VASSNRFQPKTGRLLVLLIPAFAYLVWASSFRVIDQVSLADGSIGVLLGRTSARSQPPTGSS
jgi:hypothetical protein